MSDDEREATWSRCRSRHGADGDPRSRARRPYYVAHYLAPPPPTDSVASSASPRSTFAAPPPSPPARSSSASPARIVRDAESERTSWFRRWRWRWWWRRGERTRPSASARDSDVADRDATRIVSPESSDRSRHLTNQVMSSVAPRSAPQSSPSMSTPPPPLSPARLPLLSSSSPRRSSPSPQPRDRSMSPPPPPLLSSETLRSTVAAAAAVIAPAEPTLAISVSGAERKNVTEPEADEGATAADDDDGGGGGNNTETHHATSRKRTTKKSAAGRERKRGRQERAPTESKRVVAPHAKKSRTRRAEVGAASSPPVSGDERKTRSHEAAVTRTTTTTTTDRGGAERNPTEVSPQKKRKPATTAAATAPEKRRGRHQAGVEAAAGTRPSRDEKRNIAEKGAEEEARVRSDGNNDDDEERDWKLTKELEEEEEDDKSEEMERGASESETEADDAPSETLRDHRRKISRGDASNAKQKHGGERDVEVNGPKVHDTDRRSDRIVYDGAPARLPDRRRPKKPPTTPPPPPRGCFRRCVGRLCCCCCCSPTMNVRSRVCWSIAIGMFAAVAVVALAILAHHWHNGRGWAEARRDMSEWDAQDVRRVAGANVNDAVWATAEKLERATASVRAAWSSYSGAPRPSPPPLPLSNAVPLAPPSTAEQETAAAVAPQYESPVRLAFRRELSSPSSPVPPATPATPAVDFRLAAPPRDTSDPRILSPLPTPLASTLESETAAAFRQPPDERGASEIDAPLAATEAAPTPAADPPANSPSDKRHDPTPAVAATAAAARQRFDWRQRVRLSTELSPNHRTAGCLVLLLTLFAAVRAASPASPTKPSTAAASDASTCRQCASTGASLESLARLVRVDRIRVASAAASVTVAVTPAHACRDARLVMRMWEWVAVRRQGERPQPNRYARSDSFGVDLHLAATDAAAATSPMPNVERPAADDNAIVYDADTRRTRVTWRVATEALDAAKVAEDDSDDDDRSESRPWRALDIASALVRLESRSVSVTVALPPDAGDRQWWCVEQWVDVVLAPLLREFSAPRDDGDGGDDVGDNPQLAAVHVRMTASNLGALVFQCTHRQSLRPSPSASSSGVRSPRVEIPCDQLTDRPAIEALRRLFAGHTNRRKPRV